MVWYQRVWELAILLQVQGGLEPLTRLLAAQHLVAPGACKNVFYASDCIDSR